MQAQHFTNDSWKKRNPFAFGIICGTLIGLAVVGAVVLACRQVAVEKPSIKTVEAKRVDLLRPLVSGSVTAPDAEPGNLQADCQKFIAGLQALLAQSAAHISALRSEITRAYLASRSSEIDLDSLTAKANVLKQDLADFQQAYTGIDPLISALDPDQINQVSDIKEQFTKYQRLSGRFDNTLASIAGYRNRLAESEAAPLQSIATSQSVATNNGQITNDGNAATTTVTSQPGYVYTNPVYYYDNNPTISLWFGYSTYYPFWATSYYHPYWSHKHHYYPPHPPGHGPFPPRQPIPVLINPRPINPHPINPRPKPAPPRNTITIPANDNRHPAWTRPSTPANNQPATIQHPAWQQRPTQPGPMNNPRPAPVRPNPSSFQTQTPRPQNISPKPQANRPAPQQQRSTPPPSRPTPPPRQASPPSRPSSSFQPAPQRQSPPPGHNGGGRRR
jgi:hypothetical protein